MKIYSINKVFSAFPPHACLPNAIISNSWRETRFMLLAVSLSVSMLAGKWNFHVLQHQLEVGRLECNQTLKFNNRERFSIFDILLRRVLLKPQHINFFAIKVLATTSHVIFLVTFGMFFWNDKCKRLSFGGFFIKIWLTCDKTVSLCIGERRVITCLEDLRIIF